MILLVSTWLVGYFHGGSYSRSQTQNRFGEHSRIGSGRGAVLRRGVSPVNDLRKHPAGRRIDACLPARAGRRRWGLGVLAPFTERTRVCTYDRLNVGRSDTVPGRHTGSGSVRDLDALLDAAGVPPPYVLIGFSFGGLLASMYAGAHPDQVAGLMSIHGSLPSDDDVTR